MIRSVGGGGDRHLVGVGVGDRQLVGVGVGDVGVRIRVHHGVRGVDVRNVGVGVGAGVGVGVGVGVDVGIRVRGDVQETVFCLQGFHCDR